jgi:plastocyanin
MTVMVGPSAGRNRARTAAFLLVASLVLTATAAAGEVRVELQSRDGLPVPGVAVVLEGPAGAPIHATGHHAARMDQQDRRFVPQVLVVDTGTSVEFPNSDHVSHQVYSFSPARPFQLPLYKGAPHAPVTFPTAGLVVLGCNIHDEMIGYILVTESPFHGTTDANGSARMREVPAGTYRVTAWGPLIHDGGGTVTASLVVGVDAAQTLTLRLKDPLRRSPSPRPGRADWDGY